MIAEPPIVQEAERVKAWVRLIVLVVAVAGLAALVGLPVVGGARGLVIGVVLAVVFWSGAVFLHLTWVATPSPEKRTHRVETADGVEFRIGLRPHLPLSMLMVSIMLVVLGAAFAFALGTTAWLIVGGLFALLGLVPVPDTVRALTASGRVSVLDARGFTYRGYSYETRVGWDDIESGALDKSNPRLVAIAFMLRPGATLTWTRRKWIARMEPDPSPRKFAIPALVVDQPWNLLALCEGMAETPAEHRSRYLESVGTRMLTDAEFGRN